MYINNTKRYASEREESSHVYIFFIIYPEIFVYTCTVMLETGNVNSYFGVLS